jgi:hypothetical protein
MDCDCSDSVGILEVRWKVTASCTDDVNAVVPAVPAPPELRCSDVVWGGADDKNSVNLTHIMWSGAGGKLRDSVFLVGVEAAI